MSSVRSLPTTLSTLFTTTADMLGRSTGCIQRVVKFSGATLAQTLVFGWLATPSWLVGAPLSDGSQLWDRDHAARTR